MVDNIPENDGDNRQVIKVDSIVSVAPTNMKSGAIRSRGISRGGTKTRNNRSA